MHNEAALAVDLGGTKVEGALVTSTGEVLAATRFREPTGSAAGAEVLDNAVRSVLDQVLDAEGDTAVVGVGVATAGPLDEASGTVSPINLPGWRGHPLASVVCNHVGSRLPNVPVVMRRDGVAIALAEHWLGAGQGVDNMMGMVISTGIGGGIILGGRVIGGNAGHIGQIEVSEFEGEESLGRRTTLESVAAGPHIVAWAQRQGFTGSTGEDLAAAYRNGDDIAAAAVTRLVRVMGQGIASAAALLDIDRVIIGGGFSHVAPDLLPRFNAEIATYPLDYVARLTVVPAGLGGDAPLVGAAAFIHHDG